MKMALSTGTASSYPPMPPDLVERYLRLLGLRRRAPSLDGLRELVKSHLCRVPFENISKLYYKKQLGLRTLPGLERFLDGIEYFNFGGTCYPNNFYFYQLLANLGYPVMLCGADMSNPDVHLVSTAELENRQYLIDVGYAAPFIIPLPRDLNKDYAIQLGRDRYVLRPQDELGRSPMDLYRNSELKHSYLAKPTPRQISEFDAVIAHSYRDEATFMNAILLARFFPDRSLVIHNLTVIESHESESRLHKLTGQDELTRVIAEEFRISPEITGDVLSTLVIHGDAWS